MLKVAARHVLLGNWEAYKKFYIFENKLNELKFNYIETYFGLEMTKIRYCFNERSALKNVFVYDGTLLSK